MARRRPVILIVDDEKNILTSLSTMLDLEGFQPMVAGGGRVALDKLSRSEVDAVLLDVRMPDMNGMAVLEEVRQKYPDLPVIMMSGHASLDTAVQAIQAGAHDFIEKPVGTDRLLVTLRNALRYEHLRASHQHLERRLAKGHEIVGESRAVIRLRDEIALAAPTRARVLITGENGTGKELIARAIHDGSKRSRAPFIKVNCAAIPTELIESELFGHEKGAFTGAHRERKGKFELAHGGTLFLDEIGDMRLDVQAKLLRVLQESEVNRVGGSAPISVDVRVVAATNKNLEAEIAADNFREDLYYRINVIPVHSPALRDRPGDIGLLVQHFLAMSCEENDRRPKRVEPAALNVMANHDWPGNIRELRNICERLVILTAGDDITARDIERVLPNLRAARTTGYTRDRPLRDMVADAERGLITAALDDHDGHITNAANSLGLERSHLYKKMKSLGLRD